jgi:hypothetical protein
MISLQIKAQILKEQKAKNLNLAKDQLPNLS